MPVWGLVADKPGHTYLSLFLVSQHDTQRVRLRQRGGTEAAPDVARHPVEYFVVYRFIDRD